MNKENTQVIFGYTRDMLFYIVISSITFGLAFGQAISSVVTEDRLFFVILCPLAGVALGFLARLLGKPVARARGFCLTYDPEPAATTGDE